jgi:hypothetical protein
MLRMEYFVVTESQEKNVCRIWQNLLLQHFRIIFYRGLSKLRSFAAIVFGYLLGIFVDILCLALVDYKSVSRSLCNSS